MDDRAREIMRDFALRTGLAGSDRPSVRYLWTDAHAVCNWLGLYAERADPEALKLALELVEETHRVLGRHRDVARAALGVELDDALIAAVGDDQCAVVAHERHVAWHAVQALDLAGHVLRVFAVGVVFAARNVRLVEVVAVY